MYLNVNVICFIFLVYVYVYEEYECRMFMEILLKIYFKFCIKLFVEKILEKSQCGFEMKIIG